MHYLLSKFQIKTLGIFISPDSRQRIKAAKEEWRGEEKKKQKLRDTRESS